jgi:TonB family protein
MKTSQAKNSTVSIAPGVGGVTLFFDLTLRHSSHRFGVAIAGSLLVHSLFFGLWFSTSLFDPPEILEIREISFVDENETPPEEKATAEELEVPIGGGQAEVFAASTPSQENISHDSESRESNPSLESTANLGNKSGALNAERGAEELNVNKIGVLGLLGSVSESGSSGGELALNMQSANGVVESLKMNRSLTVGRGYNPKGKVQEGALFASSPNGKGIDDMIAADINAGEGIALRKTGRVQFAGFGGGTGGAGGTIGARSEISLYEVLNKNIGRLQYIYEKYLRTNPEIGGKVEVEVTIKSDGTVSNVVFLSSEIPIAGFKQELIEFIRRWKYESIDEGVVRVVYPLLFVKVG